CLVGSDMCIIDRFTVSSMSVLGNIVANAVNLENPIIVNAAAKLENGLYYKIYEDYVEITYCDKSAEGEIIIPETIEGLPVKSIGDDVFGGFLTSITIPDSVTNIGDRAFDGCFKLKSVTIPSRVTNIGAFTFFGCSSLTSVVIPNSVTSIGFRAFSGCSLLESITIPDSVTEIEDYAFTGCSSLKSITIPDSVTNIGSGSFSRCFDLESITIPDSVTEIGDYAFTGCSSLKSITIPNVVTSIKECAFQECYALTSIIIPNSVTSIKCAAFEGCSSLKFITIPNSVTSIERDVFRGCSSLTSITIQNPDCEIDISISEIDATAVIYGYPGSTAQAYAEKYNREFVALDGNQDTTDSEILWGDANGDSTVDISDVVLMNRVYVGVDEISNKGLTNADVDQSGKIELSDSMNVLKLLVHLLDESDFPIQGS
ncbi:MAG: leucine-rich repeat protein, partial [Oscillospiraceae bacterium]|nr:leucine-rich repeat protein [Oscillospiraceae bacterium]